jgi:hypothetical protein
VNPVPPQLDITARFVYKDEFWIGAGYRTQDAIYGMLGVTYQKNLLLGFAYDYPVSDINKYSFGTTELYIAIKFNRTKLTNNHPE